MVPLAPGGLSDFHVTVNDPSPLIAALKFDTGPGASTGAECDDFTLTPSSVLLPSLTPLSACTMVYSSRSTGNIAARAAFLLEVSCSDRTPDERDASSAVHASFQGV